MEAITISKKANQLATLKDQTYLGKKVNPQIALSQSASDLLLATSDKRQRLKSASDAQLQELDNILLSITGAQFDSNEAVIMNYVKYMTLLKDVFGQYTIDEIIIAYKLAKAGKLSNHKNEQFILYRELNFASAADVLLAFVEYKKQELGKWIQNQKLFEEEEKMIDDQEKYNIVQHGLRQLLADAWALSKNNKLSETTGVFLYDSLKSIALLNLTRLEKTSIQAEAEKTIKDVIILERYAALDKITYNHFNNLLISLSGESPEVVIMSKKIALKTQIQKWITEGLTLNDIQSQIK
jgi:hypothetical protein